MTTVVPARNPLWSAPYNDPDAAAYGEAPSAREFEIRAANAVPGSGSLLLKRTNVSQIVVNERTGQQLDGWTATTGFAADANVTVATYSATHPTGYSGNHLEIQATATSSTTRGARKAHVFDLSVYGGGTLLRFQRRCTSVTNLTRWAIRYEFATSSDWAEFTLFAAADTINTWAEVLMAKGNPRATNGTVDWSNVKNIYVFVACSGNYAGNLELVDERIGLVQTAKTVPDSDPAWESSYDARVRYHDDATPKINTTTAAAVAAAATNVKMTSVTPSTGFTIAAGDWLTIETSGLVESRLITVVGTSGAGGTGVTVSEGFTYAHGSGDTVKVHNWGAWTSWLTVKTSQPPTVAAASPADAATVTDPTPDLTHTFTSPASKVQASRELRVYQRVATVDQLIRTTDTTGTGLTDTLPRFLLATGLTYAWEKDAYDSDGLIGSTTRRAFTTSFSTPAAIANLTATEDAPSSSVALAWDASVDANFDHYRVYWRNASGVYVRVDGGPAVLDDGLTPLTTAAFTHYGGRLGTNDYIVTQHNGVIESAPTQVSVTLDQIDVATGQSAIVRDGEARYTFGIRVSQSPMPRSISSESFAPPGGGDPTHLFWGIDGRKVSLSVRYRPSTDGDIVTLFDELATGGLSFWLKLAAGYSLDPMRLVILGFTPSTDAWGWMNLALDLETSRT